MIVYIYTYIYVQFQNTPSSEVLQGFQKLAQEPRAYAPDKKNTVVPVNDEPANS
jgi:hypothetical protein